MVGASVCGECSDVCFSMYYDISSGNAVVKAFCHTREYVDGEIYPVDVGFPCIHGLPGIKLTEEGKKKKIRESFSNSIKVGSFGLGSDGLLGTLSKIERDKLMEELDDLFWKGAEVND